MPNKYNNIFFDGGHSVHGANTEAYRDFPTCSCTTVAKKNISRKNKSAVYLGKSQWFSVQKKTITLFLVLASCFPKITWAQTAGINGYVFDSRNTAIPFAHIRLDASKTGAVSNVNGQFKLTALPSGKHMLTVSALGFRPTKKEVTLTAGEELTLNFTLPDDTSKMRTVEIQSHKTHPDMGRMADVENSAIYAGKKNEVILLENIQGNTAANTARQLFAKVPGLHIQENDGAGIQMSVSTRGLNPSRMFEFNVRQNGYDIAADALGYPESYYTPPAFVLQKIEVIRGAASLQYGPQFGGLINFVMKKGPAKPLQGEIQATYGSFNFIALNASLGGSKGKFNYYGYVGKRRGDGWRTNTEFDVTNGFVHFDWKISKKVSVGLEYTGMLYTMRQPGGLTDKQFAEDARQSLRNRNWFSASWNVVNNTIDWQISKNSKLNVRNFVVIANRYSVGNLNAVTEVDTGGFRNLQADRYLNFGSEIRFMHTYKLRKTQNTVLTGVRIYRGSTHRMQGLGSNGSGADFSFMHPDQVEDSDFRFPSWNLAWFAENVFHITSRFSVTPGVRVEFIETTSQGYYNDAGVTRNENKSRGRAFALAGLGLAYKTTETTQLYGNFSQNYSAVNFNDIRVNNPNLRVDPNINDVKGFNADLGYRGHVKNYLFFDVSAYYLFYKGRIGTITQYDENFNIFQYRTNLADSRNIGAEAYAEVDFLSAAKCGDKAGNLNLFVSAAYTDARYTNSQNKTLEGKRVELAPAYIVRAGLSYRIKGFATQFQYAYTAQQFTDANNTMASPNGITGVIPAYGVADFSASYEFRRIKISAGCNNLLNAKYFTRRASGYPGPGILPSDPRNFYVTLAVKL